MLKLFFINKIIKNIRDIKIIILSIIFISIQHIFFINIINDVMINIIIY